MTVSLEKEKPLIALFAPNLEGGGAERVLVNLSNGLCELGYPVDVVLATATGPLLSELPKAARVFDLQSPKVSLSILALRKYLHQQRPHSVLAFLERSSIAATWAGFLAGNKTRVIATVHAMSPMVVFTRQSAWKTFLHARLARHAYKNATAVVAVSNCAADSLANTIGLERKRISVIYNPVITPKFLEQSSGTAEHPWLNETWPPVIVGIGSFTRVKDFPTMLRAFAKVRAQLSCRLLIMGEGVRRSELEQLIVELGVSQDVLLPGFIANPYPILKRSSVFVLSSRQEGLGNALIEALRLGVPCVATDCGGPSEILAGGKYGALVPVGDVDAMAAAIRIALTCPRTVVPEAAWQPFTLDTAADAYERILV